MAGRLTPVVGTVTHDRVAFCGPLGVGKTTAVRVVSDVEVADTDVRRTAGTGVDSRAKKTTTVGIDYGEWHREGGPKVAVYGTPGQVRFEAVRSGALSTRLRLVLWLFGQNGYALEEADEWLRYLGATDRRIYGRLTVAVTRLDHPGEHPSLEDFRRLVDRYGATTPLVAADPRQRSDVERVVAIALGPRLRRRAEGAS